MYGEKDNKLFDIIEKFCKDKKEDKLHRKKGQKWIKAQISAAGIHQHKINHPSF